jgi:DNA-binding HxlR family transcriptional regulator
VLAHEQGHHDGRWRGEGGEAHRADGQPLLVELDAARAARAARRDQVLALDQRGFVDPDEIAGLREAVAEAVSVLRARGSLRTASRSQTAQLGERERWVTEDLGTVLAEGLIPEAARVLAARGLPPVTVVFFLDRARGQVVVDAALFARLARADRETRMALEDHQLLAWRHGERSERELWAAAANREASTVGADDLVGGLPVTPLGQLVGLRALTKETTSGGRPKVVAGGLPDGTEVSVMRSLTPEAMVRAAAAANFAVRAGVPTARAWLAVTTQPLRDATGTVLVDEAMVVLVREMLPGEPARLDRPEDGASRNQVAGEYAVVALLQDPDLTRATPEDRILEGGLVWSFDFDQSLLHGFSTERGMRIGARPEIYGRLSGADVLAQLEHLARMRHWLLDAVPGGEPRRMIAARLTWASAAVQTGELPEQLLNDLDRAAAQVRTSHPNDPDPDGPYLPRFAEARANQAAEWNPGPPETVEPRMATDDQLLLLLRSGRPVWVHHYRRTQWGAGVWEITLRPGDVDDRTSQLWTPDIAPADPRALHTQLVDLVGDLAPAPRTPAPGTTTPGTTTPSTTTPRTTTPGTAAPGTTTPGTTTPRTTTPGTTAANANPPDTRTPAPDPGAPTIDGDTGADVSAVDDPLAALATHLAATGAHIVVVQPEMVLLDSAPTLLGALDAARANDRADLAEQVSWLAGELSALGRVAIWIRGGALTGADLAALSDRIGSDHPELRWVQLTTCRHTVTRESSGPGPGHGPLGELTDAEAETFAGLLDRLVTEARFSGDGPTGLGARGPPLVLLDPGAARPVLAEAGLAADLPERLVAFAWTHPSLGPVLVLFAPVAIEIADLLALGLLDQAWWEAVVDHERGHHNGHWRRVGDQAHRDHGGALLAAWRAARGDPLTAITDRHGRIVLLDAGTTAPEAVTSVVELLVDELFTESAGSAVVVRAGGGTVDLLTNRHVVENALTVTVRVGEHTLRGRVLDAPPAAAIAAVFTALNPNAATLPEPDLLSSLEQLDLRLVRITATDPRLVPVAFGVEPTDGQRLTIIGLPARELPTVEGAWDNRSRDGRRPVVSSGWAAPSRWGATVSAEPWDLVIAGARWTTLGSSGGPVLARDERGERLVAVYRARAITTRDADGTQLRSSLAVQVDAARAFLSASWRDDPAARDGRPLDGAERPAPRDFTDDPVLATRARVLLGRAHELLARAVPVLVADPVVAADLIGSAADLGGTAGYLTRRAPEALAGAVADLDARVAETTDRLIAALTRVAQNSEGTPSAELVDTVLVLTQRMSGLTSTTATAQRRLFTQLLELYALIEPRLDIELARPGPVTDPRRAGLRELAEAMGDAFDTVTDRARATGAVPAPWRGAVAAAAADWTLRQIESLIDRLTALDVTGATRADAIDAVSVLFEDVQLLTGTDPGPVADRVDTVRRWLVEAGHRRGPPGHAIALTDGGAPTELDAEAAHVLDELLAAARVVEADRDAHAAASPDGRWHAAGVGLGLVEGLNAEFARRLAAIGRAPIVLVYVVDHAGRRIVADRALFQRRIRGLDDTTRRFAEHHELAHFDHPGWPEDRVWSLHRPAPAVLDQLATLVVGAGPRSGLIAIRRDTEAPIETDAGAGPGSGLIAARRDTEAPVETDAGAGPGSGPVAIRRDTEAPIETDAGAGPGSGLVAVRRDTGAPVETDAGELGQVLAALDSSPERTRSVPTDSAAYRLVDPSGVWAEHRPALYAVTGLNDDLADQRFAVIFTLAPDPRQPGRAAVFVDARVLSRLVLVTEPGRAELAARVAAVLGGPAAPAPALQHPALQHPALQHPGLEHPALQHPALLALVRPELGTAALTGEPLSERDQNQVAVLLALGLGRQPARRPGGVVVLDPATLAAGLDRLGLGRLRTELLVFTGFDAHGRRWQVLFRHTAAELAKLSRAGFLPADFQDRLLATAEAGDRRSVALLTASLLSARIRVFEIGRARQLDRQAAMAPLGLRSLLSQLAWNPGVGFEQLRSTALGAPLPVDQARAVLAVLAEFGLLRAGADDGFGPVRWVTELMARVADRRTVAEPWELAVLERVAALLSTRPALWNPTVLENVRQLLVILLGDPVLARDTPPVHLDVLHTLAASPAGMDVTALDVAARRVVPVLRDAGLVTDLGAGRFRVGSPVRRLLGDLANLEEIRETGHLDYARELRSLAGLLNRRLRARGVGGPLGEAVARLRVTEGSPLNPDTDRGPLWQPDPNSYGGLLLAIRDRPGATSTDLETRLGLPANQIRASARRLARLGLVQLVHTPAGGEYYLLRGDARAQISDLEHPDDAEGAYREALLELAELLMHAHRDRPSLAELGRAVRALRDRDESPLEATARHDELYEPPVASLLDILFAIGARPASGVLELSLTLGVHKEFVRGELTERLVPVLVTRTRKAMDWGHTYLVVRDSLDPDTTSPHRSKFLHTLTPLGEMFLAALREPELALPEDRDRAALHRIAVLLRRNPGHDRLDWPAILAAVRRLFAAAPTEDTGSRPPPGLRTIAATLRATLDAVAATPDGVSTATLEGLPEYRGLLIRLSRLASWGLLEQLTEGSRVRYRMPEHTRALLHDLDFRATFTDRRYRAALTLLAGWLEQPASLQSGLVTTRRIADHLDVLRGLPASPLPEPAARSITPRQLLDVIGAHPEGATVTDIQDTLSGLDAVSLLRRLHALHGWGLIERTADPDTGGRRYRYRLTEPARRLLEHLDDRVHQPNPTYLALLDELAGRFDSPIALTPRARRTRALGRLLDEIRLVPGAALPEHSIEVLHRESVRYLLDVLARDGELTAGALSRRSPGVTASTVGTRMVALHDWGLLDRRRINLAGGGTAFAYRLSEPGRRLLADLDDHSDPDLPVAYARALDRLGELLALPLTLRPSTEETAELRTLLEDIRALDASPLTTRERAPPSSYRGTLDLIVDAGAAGASAEDLAALTGIGITPMRDRLRRLLAWGLVVRVSAEGTDEPGRRRFRLAGVTEPLLVALDHPTNFTLEHSQRALRALDELFSTPTAKLGPGSRERVSSAIAAVAAIPNSPLRALRSGPPRESVWASLLVIRDAPDGATAHDISTATGLGGHAARGRLFALTESGWLVRRSGTGKSRSDRYGLPAHTRALLEDLDDLAGIEAGDYRDAAVAVADALTGSVGLRPGQPGTAQILGALEAVRSPLYERYGPPGPHIAEDSLWATLDLVHAAGPEPVSAEHLAVSTGQLAPNAMRRRLGTLADWGLVRSIRGAGGVRHFWLPIATRVLLAELAHPDHLTDGAYRAAATRLGPLLGENANLLPSSPKTEPLARAVGLLYDLDASPLARAGAPTPRDSLRGTLVGLADVARAVTVPELAEELLVSESGLLGRLVSLSRRGLVRRTVRWGTGAAPDAVEFVLTERGRQLLDELTEPGRGDRPTRRAATERLAAVFGVPTSTLDAHVREVIETELDAVAALPDSPLGPEDTAITDRAHPVV